MFFIVRDSHRPVRSRFLSCSLCVCAIAKADMARKDSQRRRNINCTIWKLHFLVCKSLAVTRLSGIFPCRCVMLLHAAKDHNGAASRHMIIVWSAARGEFSCS